MIILLQHRGKRYMEQLLLMDVMEFRNFGSMHALIPKWIFPGSTENTNDCTNLSITTILKMYIN